MNALKSNAQCLQEIIALVNEKVDEVNSVITAPGFFQERSSGDRSKWWCRKFILDEIRNDIYRITGKAK